MRLLSKVIVILLVINIILNINESDGVSAGFIANLFKCGIIFSNECCHKENDKKDWIDYKLQNFDENLISQLHGQHLARNLISKLIHKHLKNENPNKALVLSFHGWTGSGKNFVSKILAKNLYRKYRESEKSDFVHEFFMTRFSGYSISDTRLTIEKRVRDGIMLCERSLYIFDEIDKLPPGVIDVIKPYLDFNSNVDGIDPRKAIFIFLSNTGGKDVTNITYEFYLNGKNRNDLKLKDFEPIINRGAFNEKGGLSKCDIIEKNLIDVFVPFLPLEKKHVERCVKDYLKTKYNKTQDFIESVEGIELIRDVANEMEYSPPDTKLYSVSGCKKVATKVDVLLD